MTRAAIHSTGGSVVIVEATGENNAGPIEATSNNDGTYTASYTPTKEGADTVSITLDGTPIQGSPFGITVAAIETGVNLGSGGTGVLNYAYALE